MLSNFSLQYWIRWQGNGIPVRDLAQVGQVSIMENFPALRSDGLDRHIVTCTEMRNNMPWENIQKWEISRTKPFLENTNKRYRKHTHRPKEYAFKAWDDCQGVVRRWDESREWRWKEIRNQMVGPQSPWWEVLWTERQEELHRSGG